MVDVNALLTAYQDAMGGVRLKAGLKAVMDVSGEGNRFMQDVKPWESRGVDIDACASDTAVICNLVWVRRPGEERRGVRRRRGDDGAARPRGTLAPSPPPTPACAALSPESLR